MLTKLGSLLLIGFKQCRADVNSALIEQLGIVGLEVERCVRYLDEHTVKWLNRKSDGQ